MISSAIVVEIESRDADAGMESDPFVKKLCLILEDRADGQGMWGVLAVKSVAQDSAQRERRAKRCLCAAHKCMPASSTIADFSTVNRHLSTPFRRPRSVLICHSRSVAKRSHAIGPPPRSRGETLEPFARPDTAIANMRRST